MTIYQPLDPREPVPCPRCPVLHPEDCFLCDGRGTIARSLADYIADPLADAKAIFRRRAAAWFAPRGPDGRCARPPGCTGCGAIGARGFCFCFCSC